MRAKSKDPSLIINSPFPFRKQQLSLARQKRDKEIRLQREELEKKRKEYEDLQLHWKQSEVQFRQYAYQREKDNRALQKREHQLKRDLFKLTIRRDQIEARTNPALPLQRAKTVKQYLRCLPYTAGNRLQSIKFWQSESRFFRLKFLFEIAVDRYLGRSEIQRNIVKNLNRIVYCRKVRFGSQLIMVCIKQINLQVVTGKSNRSHWNPVKGEGKKYEILVYGVTGKYFCMKKTYSYEYLMSCSEELTQNDLIPKNIRHRLSVADNLAKLNALKTLAAGGMEGSGLDSTPKLNSSVSQPFKVINESINQSENKSVTNNQRIFTDRQSHSQSHSQTQSQNQRITSSNEDSDQSKNVDQNIFSQGNDSSDSDNDRLSHHTRKSVKSKSSFCPKPKTQTASCKFNRGFLSGLEETLFPVMQPLLNLVVLPLKNELYLLSEYIEMTHKKQLLEKSIARFRLKMKLKAQLRKCLLYKVIKMDKFYETQMFLQQDINLQFLFVLKREDTPEAKQVQLYCNSIAHHPKIPSAIRFKTLFHREIIEKVQNKEERIPFRNSNNKTLKGSARRSRESKRKSSTRNQKISQIDHQKSAFILGRRNGIESWTSFSVIIKQKLDQFLRIHLLSLHKASFIPLIQFSIKRQKIIGIQAFLRRFICRSRYKKYINKAKTICNYNKLQKILISCLFYSIENKIIVFVESLDFGRSEESAFFNFSVEHVDIVFHAVKSFHNEGSLQEVRERIGSLIENTIEMQTQIKIKKQRERPEKNRRAVERFKFMTAMRIRARENIFHIKKIAVREKLFLLLIRRDSRIRSLLECHLYDVTTIPVSQPQIGSGKQSKEMGSEYGWHKQVSQSGREFINKNYRYQKIYLMDQYFDNIEKKLIADQFFIDRGVFLLKPQKTLNNYFIQRLSSIDINSDEISKEITIYEKEEFSYNRQSQRQSPLISNKSFIKKNVNNSNEKKYPLNAKQKIEMRNKDGRKMGKKTSIDAKQNILDLFKSTMAKQSPSFQHHSRASMGQTNSHKGGRPQYKIAGNSHDSIIYYSLYKSEDIFFYLELYIVTKIETNDTYTEELVSIQKQRLYKKQLEEHGIGLIMKKLAAWVHENEGQMVQIRQTKDKVDEQISKKDFQGLNFINLQLFSALLGQTSKRLSADFDTCIAQKGNRTNTLTF